MKKTRKSFDPHKALRIWTIDFVAWLVFVCVMWWGATQSGWAALIAVPVAALTAFGFGSTFKTMAGIAREAGKWDRRRFVETPFYKLEGREVVRLDGFDAWKVWVESHHRDRIIKVTTFGPVQGDDDCRVSTVFIGLGHMLDMQGRPLVFETMIFGSPLNGHDWKSATYDDAIECHIAATLLVKELLEEYHDPTAARNRREKAHLN